MTRNEATQVVVQMAMARSEASREGEALRMILRELKDQRTVGLKMEAALHEAIKMLEEAEKGTQAELFEGGEG